MLHPVMRGECYGKQFVAVKVVDTDGNEYVATFAMRYADDPNTWTHGTCYRSVIYWDSRVRASAKNNLPQRMKTLLAGETLRDFDMWDPEWKEEFLVLGNGSTQFQLAR